jgi:hypothetical protein
VLLGAYLVVWSFMFLAAYYFSRKSFFLRVLMWVCERLSRPGDKRMAFFYFALGLCSGLFAILRGLEAL